MSRAHGRPSALRQSASFTQIQAIHIGKREENKKWSRALHQAQSNQQKYNIVKKDAVSVVKHAQWFPKLNKAGELSMTLYCSLHFPRQGRDELWVLEIKASPPPLARVKQEPYALSVTLPLKHVCPETQNPGYTNIHTACFPCHFLYT